MPLTNGFYILHQLYQGRKNILSLSQKSEFGRFHPFCPNATTVFAKNRNVLMAM